jgi:hypothetical protein
LVVAVRLKDGEVRVVPDFCFAGNLWQSSKRGYFRGFFVDQGIVPKPFQGEFGIFWGFEKSEGLFSRGRRGFLARVVPAR